MTTRYAFLLLLVGTIAVAQPAPLLELPEDLAAIRASQARLAGEQDVEIRFIDTAERSASSLDGVPAEFRDEIIQTEYDLIGLFDRLYPYYGLTGTETLEFQNAYQVFEDMRYHFREYIDGIATNQLFHIDVDLESKRIQDLSLWLYMDRDLPRQPAMSETEAIERALCFVDKVREFRNEEYVADGAHDVEVVYETWGEEVALIPVWRVTPARIRGNSGYNEDFTIMPGGIVRRGAVSSHGDSKEPFVCADEDAVPEWVTEQ